MTRDWTCYCLMLLLGILCYGNTLSQSTLPIERWVNALDNEDRRHAKLWEIKTFLDTKDSTESFAILTELEKAGAGAGYRFRIKLKWLKAYTYYELTKGKSVHEIQSHLLQLNTLLKSALFEAYGAGDDHLATEVSRLLGFINMFSGRTEEGIMYSLNTLELMKKLGNDNQPEFYFTRKHLGEFLHQNREYNKSTSYLREAIQFGSGGAEGSNQVVNMLNTIALNYIRSNLTVQANVVLDTAKRLANILKDSLWMGILSGTMGELKMKEGHFEEAIPYLETYYTVTKQFGEYSNTANALQLMSFVHIVKREPAQAIALLHEGLEYLERMPRPSYLLELYRHMTVAFEQEKRTDSAYHYFKLFTRLNDSMEMAILKSRSNIAAIRSDHERSLYRITALQNEKHAEMAKRNFYIIIILAISIIALLYVNRQRVQLKLKEQEARQEKARVAAEKMAAEEQIELFRLNLLEKTRITEELKEQLTNRGIENEHIVLIEELSSQTILTDSDWERFKKIFEKVYPGFLMHLKELAPDITVAEQRMAALTRLHLSTKQVASILGISVDSVHKSRQRLRQRLNISTEVSLESSIADI